MPVDCASFLVHADFVDKQGEMSCEKETTLLPNTAQNDGSPVESSDQDTPSSVSMVVRRSLEVGEKEGDPLELAARNCPLSRGCP